MITAAAVRMPRARNPSAADMDVPRPHGGAMSEWAG